MGASASAPLRHDIDAACASFDAAAQRSNVIFPLDAGGTYAHVYARGTVIASVYFFTPETQTAAEKTSSSCYLHGRLARQRTHSIVPGTTVAWIRTKYWADDGTFMTETDVRQHLIAGDAPGAVAAPRPERVYATPGALPFYAAFRAKHHR